MEQTLYWAAAWGELENVRETLQNYPQIDIDWQNEDGKSSLFIASSWGHWDVVQLLLERGAGCGENVVAIINLLDMASYYLPRQSNNRNVYFYDHRHDKKHEALEKAKIFIRSVIKGNRYPDLLATVQQDDEMLSHLEVNPQQGIPDYIMNIVLYYNHFETIMLLADAVALSNRQHYLERLSHCRNHVENESEQKGQKLYNAAACGDIEQVRTILSGAANLNINWTNSKGNSTLFIAAAWGLQDENKSLSEIGDLYNYYNIAQLLIERGADVNLINKKNQSVLHIGSLWGHWDIVKLLIENGASTSEKETLLSIASNTQPRDGEVPRDLGTYYSAHTISSKNHALEIAKKYISHILESGQYLDVLTDAQEDYKTLISPDLQCQEGVPDDIMNIVIYYNHFATVAQLLNATAATEELQKYNTILLRQRQCYEVARIHLDQQLKTECKQEGI